MISQLYFILFGKEISELHARKIYDRIYQSLRVYQKPHIVLGMELLFVFWENFPDKIKADPDFVNLRDMKVHLQFSHENKTNYKWKFSRVNIITENELEYYWSLWSENNRKVIDTEFLLVRTFS